MSDLLPNTYPKPNKYSDLYDYYLTPEESRVLDFFIRHILGWETTRGTRRNRLSLSQLTDGWGSDEDGKWRTLGTGLSRPTVVKVVKSLLAFGFIREIGAPTKDGQEYELVHDDSKIDLDALIIRKEGRKSQEQKRTETARSKRGQSDLPVSDTNQSDKVVNAINQQRSMRLTSGGKSHLPEVVNAINTLNPSLNPSDKQINKSILGANAPTPPPPVIPPPPPPTESEPARKEQDDTASSKSSAVEWDDIPAAPVEARDKMTVQQAEVGAWGAVMGLDVSVPANAKRVGNMLIGLRKSKECQPTVEVARDRFGRLPPADGSWNFYTDTWQGKRGQFPTEREINQYWSAWTKPQLQVVKPARATPARDEPDGIDAFFVGMGAQPDSTVIEGRVIRGRTA